MGSVVLLSFASYLLVALSTEMWHAYLGVILGGISAAVGEVALLSHATKFNKYVLQTPCQKVGILVF